MTVVKTLTKTGITICATIHNPTPYCFNLFDRLMILLHGRVVYSGENGAPSAHSAACMDACCRGQFIAVT
jgi:ABC-type multidrug transport system ATPase subunit